MKNNQIFKTAARLVFRIFVAVGALCGVISFIQFNAYTSDKNRLERVEKKAADAQKNADTALLYVIEVRNRLLWPEMATKVELDAICK
jgi:hypothetical protein